MEYFQGWAFNRKIRIEPELEIRNIRAVVSGSTGNFPGGSG